MLPRCQADSGVCPGLSSGRPYKNPEEMAKPLLFDTEKLQGTKHKELNGKRQVSYVGFLSFVPLNNPSGRRCADKPNEIIIQLVWN